MATMTPMERVRAAVAGEQVDRVPFCFWHHFKPHGSPVRLAQMTQDFFGGFDLDIFKIMPDIPYPFPRDSIQTADDWLLLAPLDVGSGNLGAMIDAVEILRDRLSDQAPILVTLFSPYSYAMRFAGAANMARHIRENPIELHAALGVITRNLQHFAQDAIDAGADGVFFAAQGGSDGHISRAEYGEFALPYELAVLRSAQSGWLTTLHAHGNSQLFVDDYARYPVPVISWSDRITGVSLREMRQKAPDKVLMGGIDEFGAIKAGNRDGLLAEMRDALEQTQGQRFILANGCSVPDDIDHAHLQMARDLLDELT
jgi:uroporphyrinogen decarboxylase